FIGHALCWIAMSVTLAAVLPGGAYLTLVPAIAFAVCIVLRATLDLSPGVSAIITSAVTAIVWFPVITALYDLIGRPSLGVIATLVALTATTFTPAVAPASPVRSALVAAMAAAAVLCIGMQILLPPFNPNWPRAISVQYLDDGLHPQWIVNGVTTELRKVAPFLLAPADMYPWSPTRRRAFAAPA